MPRKSQEVARSQLMAQAERLAEMGITKAAIVFYDKDGDTGMSFSGGISNLELVFAFEQAKHVVLAGEHEDDVDDDGE